MPRGWPRLLLAACLLPGLAPSARAAGDESAERWALVFEAKKALARGDLEGARKACGDLLSRPSVGAAELAPRVEGLIRCGDVDMAAKRFGAAHKSYRRASHEAEAADRLRTKALRGRIAAARALESEEKAKRAQELLVHDEAMRRLVLRPGKRDANKERAMAELEAAGRAYGADGDEARRSWVKAIRGLVMVHSGDSAGGRELLSRVDGETPFVRQVVLRGSWTGALAASPPDVDGAARAALALNALEARRLSPEGRRYHRILGLDALCRRYEERQGEGACARLELSLTGSASFTDFSTEKERAELGPGDMDRVHAQYLPVVEACVLDEARKDPDRFEDEEIRIEWVVDRTGRARNPEIAPGRHDAALRPCVEERLSWFRYPRTRSGEMKTVSVPYRLH